MIDTTYIMIGIGTLLMIILYVVKVKRNRDKEDELMKDLPLEEQLKIKHLRGIEDAIWRNGF